MAARIRQVTSELANDPYWQPDSWVNIEVKAEASNYRFTLTADTVREGLEVLCCAKRYGDERALAIAPALP